MKRFVKLLIPFISLLLVGAAAPPPQTESGLLTTYEEAPRFTEHEIEILAKMVWGEARGTSPDEQRLVVWTVFQRVDHPTQYGGTIEAVVTARNQFVGYRARNPICPVIYALCLEEAEKWARGEEPPTIELYAPTLPYLYFDGDGKNNWFRATWR